MADKVVTLFHTTSGAAAEQILDQKTMHKGSYGCVGGGIYFADNIADSKRKAHFKGVTLKASVDLGKTLVVSDLSHFGYYTGNSLKKKGYDSIKITCLDGKEYVVFNSSQVSNIDVAESSVLIFKECFQPNCARYKQKHPGNCGKLCSNKKCKMFGKLHRLDCQIKPNSCMIF